MNNYEYVYLFVYCFYVCVRFYVAVLCFFFLSYIAWNLSSSSEILRFYLENQFSGFSLKMCRSGNIKLWPHMVMFGWRGEASIFSLFLTRGHVFCVPRPPPLQTDSFDTKAEGFCHLSTPWLPLLYPCRREKLLEREVMSLSKVEQLKTRNMKEVLVISGKWEHAYSFVELDTIDI